MGAIAATIPGDTPRDQEKNEDCPPDGCPPCSPYPKGTIGYIGPHTDHDHYPYKHHVSLFSVNQNPNTCKCFWNKNNPDAAEYPQSGWVDLNSGFPALSP